MLRVYYVLTERNRRALADKLGDWLQTDTKRMGLVYAELVVAQPPITCVPKGKEVINVGASLARRNRSSPPGEDYFHLGRRVTGWMGGHRWSTR
jgi:hypothetical protein